VHSALCHHSDVIRSRDVVGNMTIRLSIDDFVHVLSRKQRLKRLKVPYIYIAVNGTSLNRYGVPLAMWDHTVLPATMQTQANTPRLNPSHAGWFSIYRPRKDGWLSKPRHRGAKSNWPTVATRPPAARGTRTPTSRSLVDHANHKPLSRLDLTKSPPHSQPMYE